MSGPITLQPLRSSKAPPMAPSRALLYASTHLHRGLRRGISSLTESLSNPTSPVLSFVSSSRDPYLNLSIEHYFLQKSHPDSTILFLYVNRPCIVLGRNQNPWYEVNLGILKAVQAGHHKETEPRALGGVELVRRRSGGGTVFHDEGNVNWSVICPPAKFSRDKHAEMVVRALRKQGIARARVNERHDIVLDQGPAVSSTVSFEDTHATQYTQGSRSTLRPLKVSGSAYKLTRLRALHHGTCLLQSPNLQVISDYLHSPAKPFIQAKGVESVSSPVANIGLSTEAFSRSIQNEFGEMYDVSGQALTALGEETLEIPEVRSGYEEMKTLDWIFSQTPQFTLSNVAEDGSPSTSSVKPISCPITVSIKHGAVFDVKADDAPESLLQEISRIPRVKLQDLRAALQERGEEEGELANWLVSTLITPR